MFDELQDGGKGLKANTQETRARLQFYFKCVSDRQYSINIVRKTFI